MKMYRIIKKYPVFQQETKYGPKEKRFFDVKEVSTGDDYSASIFINPSTPHVAVNDEVLMDIVVEGKYANIKKMETIDGLVKEEKKEEKKEGKTEEKSIDKVPNHIWEAKDRRMCRMNSLTHALKTVELSKVDTKDLETSELENLVMMSADNYLTYIYDGKKPLPIEDSTVSET